MKIGIRNCLATVQTCTLSVLLLLSSITPSMSTPKYDDTVWIPVIFYDFHPDGRSDFERCNSGLVRGMVEGKVDSQRKPVPTAIACVTSNQSAPPCACDLKDWFRPSGSSNNVHFVVDTLKNKHGDSYPKWGWRGLVPSPRDSNFFIGPLWNATDTSVNLVYYDSLPFLLSDSTKGIYTFDRSNNNQFFWLDGIGFGNERPSTIHNFGFTMELHHEFEYEGGETFNFSGDDDVWVFINDTLVLDLGGVHGNVSGSFELDNIARRLGLQTGHKYILDVFYAERHTSQSNCKIMTNLVRRPRPGKVTIQTESNKLVAGDTVKISGEVRDENNVILPEYSDSIHWSFVDTFQAHVNDRIIYSQGKVTLFTATKAYRTIPIVGYINDPYNPGVRRADTVYIEVVPAPDHHIVIEGNSNPDLWTPHPLDSITINSNETRWDSTFSTVRDTFNNLSLSKFTSAATTRWVSTITGVATVQGESGRAYHGTIQRVTSGVTDIIASDGNLIPDTLNVKVADYTIVAIRLVNIRTGEVVDTVIVWTDSTEGYQVQGLKSTYINNPDHPDAWDKNILTNWKLEDTLKSAIAPPDFGNTWTYSPTNHGEGKVILTYNGSGTTIVLNVPVIAKLSPPSRIEIAIISPSFDLVAGNIISAEVKIYNTDGLYPVDYKFGGTNANDTNKVKYYDNLGTGGGKRPNPTVAVNNVTTNLNFDFDRYSSSELFKAGKDTIQLILYYAPFNAQIDSFHVITVNVGSLRDKTNPFKLNPGPLDSLVFEDVNYVEKTGPVILNPYNDYWDSYVNGYDRFGNRRGHEFSAWSVTGGLDSTKIGNPFGDRNSYRTQNEQSGMQGLLYAEAEGWNGSVKAKIEIIIESPTAKVISAITRDTNGNGLLDRIEIRFNRKTDFYLDKNKITITYGSSTIFKVSGVVPAVNDTTLFYIELVETDTTQPQTAWLPRVELTGFADIGPTNVVATDGAAPVVWSVTKKVTDMNRKNDLMIIVLSEAANSQIGSPVPVNTQPVLVFNVWEKNDSGFTLVNKLKDIEFFSLIGNVNNATKFEFKMTNGADITENNYFNIHWENRIVTDPLKNFPDIKNQKVPVVITGSKVTVEFIPNPARPTTLTGEPGKFKLDNLNERQILDEIKTNGGALIRIALVAPPRGSKVKLFIKVYDVVGNQVIWTSTDNVFAKDDSLGSAAKSTVRTLNYSWNCTNSKGMKIAPGRYKMVVFIDYSHPEYKDERKSLEFGVQK